MSRIPFAIAGTGRIAADYLTALAAVGELRLVGVCDLRADVAAATGERWSCPAFGDPVAMLETARPRAVLVAVPPADHEAVSLACLEHGAHVLCEKPFTVGAASGRRMLEVAGARGLVLTMSAKFRHVADVIETRARLEAGVLGDIVLASNVFASEVDMRGRWNADPARGGGGVLIDNGTHSVDLLRYLFGEVCWVQAQRGPDLQGLPVEDTACMTLGFASGLLASVDLSWSVAAHLPWYLTVQGASGSIRLGWKRSLLRRRGEAEARSFGAGYDKIDAFVRQLRHFARVLAGAEPALIGPEDILASIDVVDAAYRSLASAGRRVTVGVATGRPADLASADRTADHRRRR